MAIQIEIDPKEHRPGLYDSDSGASLATEKVVDITGDCRTPERTLLLYTRALRGPIVQVCHPYDGEVYLGSNIHFFINEIDLSRRNDPRDDTFGMTARRHGLTSFQFRRLIREHAPALPNGDRNGG